MLFVVSFLGPSCIVSLMVHASLYDALICNLVEKNTNNKYIWKFCAR